MSLAGCDEPAPQAPANVVLEPAHDASAPTALAPSASSLLAARYYEGHIAETLHGDANAAREAYRDVIAAEGAPPELAAKAALKLAEYHSQARQRRVALDLIARARVLGRDSTEIRDWARRLESRLSTVRAQHIEVRGPPAGTALTVVSKKTAIAFARAEELLAAYHRRRVVNTLAQYRTTVKGKRAAMDRAVAGYRTVVAKKEPNAVAAAEFRIASLNYDISLSLVFELPPVFDPARVEDILLAADRGKWTTEAEIRGGLRAQAVFHRKKARAAYKRSLAAVAQPADGEGSSRWQDAAKLGLRSVEDLLRGKE